MLGISPGFGRRKPQCACHALGRKRGGGARIRAPAAGKIPRLFEAAGAEFVFYPAEARSNGSELRISYEAVTHPYAVWYAWVNYAEVNVAEADGLPLALHVPR